VATDDYTPLIPQVVDNGKIFAFGIKAAQELLADGDGIGDLFVSQNAYNAMVDSVVGKEIMLKRTYKSDFWKLCGSTPSGVEDGCAMFALNMAGGDNRDISTYFYQPSANPAYSNTLYQSTVMKTLETNTPTSLVQTYYSCVLPVGPAVIEAIGIGVSAGAFFVFAGFVFVCILMVFGLGIPLKSALDLHEHNIKTAKEKELHEVNKPCLKYCLFNVFPYYISVF
jgi:hypothetical protein